MSQNIKDSFKYEEIQIQKENKNNNKEEDNMHKSGEKQKRRTKNECYGRDFRCGCGKEYLSYPALYTHIKTKHDGKTPEGTNANQIQNGKGRGRPRKNFLTNEENLMKQKKESIKKYNENQSNELKNYLIHNNCSFDYFIKGENKFEYIYYFFNLLNTKEKNRIKKIYNINDNDENNININNNYINANEIEQYNLIELFTESLIKSSKSYNSLFNCYNKFAKKGLLDIDKIYKKENITCDQSFIFYLYYISKKINKEFCKINLMVIKYFRDFINILGWSLLSRYKFLDDEDTTKEFCCIKEPLKVPLLVNDFFNNYIQKAIKNIDIYFVVIIISHYCFWIYAHDLTFIKLNLPNIINDDIKDDIFIENNNNDINNKEIDNINKSVII